MLKHSDIWRAIDRLAALHGLSPSGLARRSGLDPTTFNPSKRQTQQGKLRWPSTESLAKILDATGSEMADFVRLLGDPDANRERQRVPVIGLAQAGNEGFFDDAGFPVGEGWDEILFPDIGDAHAYALEVSGDSMLPAFREGDLVVISPQAGLRRNDRVVARTREGEVLLKELARQSATRVELKSLNPEYPDRSFQKDELEWLSRIVWASQ